MIKLTLLLEQRNNLMTIAVMGTIIRIYAAS